MSATLRKVRLLRSDAQARFQDSTARFRAFIGGRGSGKTYGVASDLLMRAREKRTYLVAAPTAQLLREGMIPALLTVSEQLGILRSVRGNPLTLRLINDARVVCRTARNPDLLRGGSYSGAVLDEAALLAPTVKDIVLATLREGGKPGWMTYASTPKGKANWLYGEVATGRSNTFMVRAHSRDNPFVSEEQVASLEGAYDEFFRRQEVEGEFLDADEGTQVIPSEWIEAATRRGRDVHDHGSCSSLGVDTARGGTSRFTIAHRHGHHVPRINAYPGSRSPNSQAGASLVLAAMELAPSVAVNIDISGGTGSGVFDLLAEQPGIKARAVNFGAGTDARDRTGRYRFANVRALLYWSLREALDPTGPVRLTLPDSYELAAELSAVHWHMNGGGRIQLQPKEQIAKVLRRSPDLADAVALTMLN